MADPIGKTRTYLTEVADEMKKSSWPTWQELSESAVVIIIVVGLIGLFVGLSDWILQKIVQLLVLYRG